MLFEIISICKGGGYQYCRTIPAHPKANSKGLYPLHRVVAENKIGRLLKDGEVVHHIDEDKENNSPENLVVMTSAQHSSHHKSSDALITCVCLCGKVFQLVPSQYRLRAKRAKRGVIYCSRQCSGRRLGAST